MRRLFSIGALVFTLAVIGAACLPAPPPPSPKAHKIGGTIAPTSWDFGTFVNGRGPTGHKDFVVTNVGTLPASTHVRLPGGFGIAASDCGEQLAPNASCVITVAIYGWLAPGVHTETIRYNGGISTVTVTVL